MGACGATTEHRLLSFLGVGGCYSSYQGELADDELQMSGQASGDDGCLCGNGPGLGTTAGL
eukprot:4503861-Amphidinium_carterae.2